MPKSHKLVITYVGFNEEFCQCHQGDPTFRRPVNQFTAAILHHLHTVECTDSRLNFIAVNISAEKGNTNIPGGFFSPVTIGVRGRGLKGVA